MCVGERKRLTVTARESDAEREQPIKLAPSCWLTPYATAAAVVMRADACCVVCGQNEVGNTHRGGSMCGGEKETERESG